MHPTLNLPNSATKWKKEDKDHVAITGVAGDTRVPNLFILRQEMEIPPGGGDFSDSE
jgi:hypothetical protein